MVLEVGDGAGGGPQGWVFGWGVGQSVALHDALC